LCFNSGSNLPLKTTIGVPSFLSRKFFNKIQDWLKIRDRKPKKTMDQLQAAINFEANPYQKPTIKKGIENAYFKDRINSYS